MMNKPLVAISNNLVLLLFLVLPIIGFSQNTGIRSMEEALKEPDKVISLNFRNKKNLRLDALVKFKNLEKLNLSKNKLQSVPESIRSLGNLEELDLSKNQIDSLPDWIGELKQLKVLVVSQNPISELPNSLVDCESLRVIDAWGTRVNTLPKNLGESHSLVQIDLQSILMNRKQQEAIQNTLPERIKVGFSKPCNCID